MKEKIWFTINISDLKYVSFGQYPLYLKYNRKKPGWGFEIVLLGIRINYVVLPF